MKKFIDKYSTTQVTRLNKSEIRRNLLGTIGTSNDMVLDEWQNGELITIKSKRLEWLVFPRSSIFSANIKLNDYGNGETKIVVELRGNDLLCFFKYMALLLFVTPNLLWTINLVRPIDHFFDDIIWSSFGPLAVFFIFNFVNRGHISNGSKEISKLINRAIS